MPLTCSFCKIDIQAGELVQPDIEMNLAHKTCVDMELEKIDRLLKTVPAPVVTAPAKPRLRGAFPASPLVLCSECGKPAIGMCPHCKRHVCQGYGYNGNNCSGRHEGKCEGARMSRERNPKPLAIKSGPLFDTEPVKNGRHKSKVKKQRGRR